MNSGDRTTPALRRATRSLFQQRRSTAAAISANSWRVAAWPIFYAVDKQSSFAIFAAKRIPRSNRILSKDTLVIYRGAVKLPNDLDAAAVFEFRK
jgi:hypothetical protein